MSHEQADMKYWTLISLAMVVWLADCGGSAAPTTVATSMARLQSLVDSHDTLVQRLAELIHEDKALLSHLARTRNTATGENTDSTDLNSRQTQLAKLKRLYAVLKREDEEGAVTRRKKVAEHPNGAFKTIQNFVETWGALNASVPEEIRVRWGMGRLLPGVGVGDYRDACLALLTLQRVYRLHPPSMARGEYFHHRGPQLSPLDAYDVGNVGVASGQTDRGLQWLELAVESANLSQTPRFPMEAALARMTSTYAAMNDTTKAKKMVRQARKLGISADVVRRLQDMVTSSNSSRRHVYNETAREDADPLLLSYSRLCRRRRTIEVLQAHHVCRYRCGSSPLTRHKEMVLHHKPYISIFYHVISDSDEKEITTQAFQELLNPTVPVSSVNPNKTSQSVFLGEEQSPVLRRLTRKVESCTGLSTADHWPLAPDSAEPFLGVNYGIAGRFESHYDFFKTPPRDGRDSLKDSGNRIATFLIYVTGVAVGGNTVFPKLDLAVPPLKHGALFWYNFSPDALPDPLTLHAGCPVVIGQKWVINKWIREYGNTFRRPCPLRQSDSQWTLDKTLRPAC